MNGTADGEGLWASGWRRWRGWLATIWGATRIASRKPTSMAPVGPGDLKSASSTKHRTRGTNVCESELAAPMLKRISGVAGVRAAAELMMTASPERHTLVERRRHPKVPENSSTHVPKSYPSDPGELRRCPEVGEKYPNIVSSNFAGAFGYLIISTKIDLPGDPSS